MPRKKRKLSAQELQRQHQRALNTFVREIWGEIPAEMEVKLRSLKAWGFDLLTGLRGGHAAVFVAPSEDRRAAGDVYETQGETFKVREVLQSCLRPNCCWPSSRSGAWANCSRPSIPAA